MKSFIMEAIAVIFIAYCIIAMLTIIHCPPFK